MLLVTCLLCSFGGCLICIWITRTELKAPTADVDHVDNAEPASIGGDQNEAQKQGFVCVTLGMEHFTDFHRLFFSFDFDLFVVH